MALHAYFDSETIITAEIDKRDYNGISKSFTVLDEKNNHIETKIISEINTEEMRSYKLSVMGLEIGGNYSLADERFLRTVIKYRDIANSLNFDNVFFYNGSDLGADYTTEQTQFKVWAPLSNRVLLDLQNHGLYEMEKKDRGVFQTVVQGDLERIPYQYIANIGGQWRTANDPYAFSSTANSQKSVIIDYKKLNKQLNKQKLPSLKQKTDAVIYELHVRDFSTHTSGGIRQKGMFLGLTEEGTKNTQGDSTGIDYLVELGITHIQLLPIFDFGSVDELNQMNHYNWGYDPVHFNIPEGSYSTNSSDPYSRLTELQKTVSVLHSKGLRVIMDVVYNHMFDRVSSDFEKLVPGYYFRTGDNREISNGSFCGNDIDSTRSMVRKYILDSIKRWMTVYGIDGFRFDLMGILDIKTMNQIEELVHSIDKNAIIYGEGWNMPTLLPDEEKATMMNQDQLPRIGHFNDYFRDALKGSSMMDNITQKGLLTGETKHLKWLPGLLLGSQYKGDGTPFFSAPWKSLNYVECHDNQTSYDKMISCDVKKNQIVRRQKLMVAVVLFSRGIPFIHSGQEMLRTKGGDHNSYRSPDSINAIDWNRRSEYRELVNFVRDAICMRMETDVFRYSEYDNSTEIRIENHKQLVELKYIDGTTVLLNVGLQDYNIELKNEFVVFNQTGRVLIQGNSYTLKELELIILKKGLKELPGSCICNIDMK